MSRTTSLGPVLTLSGVHGQHMIQPVGPDGVIVTGQFLGNPLWRANAVWETGTNKVFATQPVWSTNAVWVPTPRPGRIQPADRGLPASHGLWMTDRPPPIGRRLSTTCHPS